MNAEYKSRRMEAACYENCEVKHVTHVPTLQTERLILRQFTENDGGAVYYGSA